MSIESYALHVAEQRRRMDLALRKARVLDIDTARILAWRFFREVGPRGTVEEAVDLMRAQKPFLFRRHRRGADSTGDDAMKQTEQDREKAMRLIECDEPLMIENIAQALADERGSARRRERLDAAARIVAGMYANPATPPDWTREGAVNDAVITADALIARIDASPADKEPRP